MFESNRLAWDKVKTQNADGSEDMQTAAAIIGLRAHVNESSTANAWWGPGVAAVIICGCSRKSEKTFLDHSRGSSGQRE
jgi:hypothetical protein